ncbi:MAG TPA: 50S ribosomal protein L11 methyltransferase [Gaiellaceae bacterium]
MLELFPEGFEERDAHDGVELAAYTDAGGEERLWAAFGAVSSDNVPEGWEERWRAFHRPVQVGPLWVGPPWETPPPGADAVVIDPGRAFGTGGHPTTRLCLRQLLEVETGSLLDVGCGSGVIAIAAATLGFSPVTAIDDDQVALAAARRNASANRVSVELRRGDALQSDLPLADVVVANVSWEFVAKLAPRLRARDLIVSGYLESELPFASGYARVSRLAEDGWAADLLRREE